MRLRSNLRKIRRSSRTGTNVMLILWYFSVIWLRQQTLWVRAGVGNNQAQTKNSIITNFPWTSALPDSKKSSLSWTKKGRKPRTKRPRKLQPSWLLHRRSLQLLQRSPKQRERKRSCRKGSIFHAFSNVDLNNNDYDSVNSDWTRFLRNCKLKRRNQLLQWLQQLQVLHKSLSCRNEWRSLRTTWRFLFTFLKDFYSFIIHLKNALEAASEAEKRAEAAENMIGGHNKILFFPFIEALHKTDLVRFHDANMNPCSQYLTIHCILQWK